MIEPPHHLPRDLRALRYLDALQAGDLEAVAAFWEEAGRDPVLEAMLAELDDALFAEEVEANQIRAAELPGARPPSYRRRWLSGAGIAALAAACLLAVLGWPGRKAPLPTDPERPTNTAMRPVKPQEPKHGDAVAAVRKVRRVLDGDESPAYTWPLANTLTVASRSDWLD
jgi:hypothetical protein